LRSSDLDVRIIALTPAAGRDVSYAGDAAETFVLELVATVGRPSWSSSR
jgi:hypothetical protein